MSRASNLAGFTTAVGPPTDLNVGVVTATSISAQTITSTDTYSFTNLDISETISVGSSLVGVTTITSSNISLGNTDVNIEIGDIPGGFYPASTDGGVVLTAAGSTTGSGMFTELDGEILTIGNNIAQISGINTSRVGGFIRVDTRRRVAQLPGDRHCFIVKGRSEGETSEYRGWFIDFNTGDTFISPDKGNVVIGSATTSLASLDISNRTDAVALPVGTTAQRPSTASGGYIRWNSTSSALEVYNGTNWVEIISDYFPSGSTTLG
jgi:ethanolamine utilization microcompartment shell protein EutS